MASNKKANIITLTTDMGVKDYYVAALKGKIIGILSDIHIVDISHHIASFKISQAAYTVKACIKDFPDNTVHIIGVDAEPLINFSNPEDSIFPTIIKYKKQYFLGADNGFFSLLTNDQDIEGIWRLEEYLSRPEMMKFPAKNILVPAACRILTGESLDEIGTPVDGIRKALPLSPIMSNNMLKGTVIHIDHYGNVISNITKEHFNHFGPDVPFTIFFRDKQYYIDRISTGYNEVTHGEKLAFFNDNGFLEIAINKGTPENGGGANTLLGLKLNDIIRIEFTPRGSKTTIDSLF
ncbi:MAG: SAM-dependent chlorinase/fluorinase [Brumimicrobium sp.]|nr:SAM-dependent chlorinase/fluorinase [Brumimicrobium sp.]MCO5268177.1 SAM-dependent chlorinase/fluorinase [Brumimicrobium sp.]